MARALTVEGITIGTGYQSDIFLFTGGYKKDIGMISLNVLTGKDDQSVLADLINDLGRCTYSTRNST